MGARAWRVAVERGVFVMASAYACSVACGCTGSACWKGLGCCGCATDTDIVGSSCLIVGAPVGVAIVIAVGRLDLVPMRVA